MRLTLAYLFAAVVMAVGAAEPVNPADTKSQIARENLIKSARRPAPMPGFHIRNEPEPTLMPVPPRATSSLVAPPPPQSPGIALGTTWIDVQNTASQGRRVARNAGNDRVQFVWDATQAFDQSGEWLNRDVFYNTYSISAGTLLPGPGGASLNYESLLRASAGNIAVEDNEDAHVILLAREDIGWPIQPWEYFIYSPGLNSHLDFQIGHASGCPDATSPRVAIRQKSAEDDIIHVIYRQSTVCNERYLYYTRSVNYQWSPPVIIDSTFSTGYVIAVDPTSDDVVIVLHDIADPQFNGANNIVYYRSTTAGAGWISGTELGPANRLILTNYGDTLGGPQAWRYIDALFDNAGTLHIVWDEQQLANQTANVAIRHWNDQRNTIRTVALGYWAQPAKQNSMNLANLSMGIGNGSTPCSSGPGGNNYDYLYLIYTKYCGLDAAEQADTSVAGYCNGEVYLTVSSSGGDTWSTPVNLTETKTPDCDPANPETVCRSDDWASLNPVVVDLDIRYIGDHDAGAALYGEGSFQLNDVLYLRIPGGTLDAERLCPADNPTYASALTQDVDCEYYAEPGAVNTTASLTLMNLGPGALSGDVSVLPGAPWLSVNGAGGYTIPGGASDLAFPITMDATLLAQGVYYGTIRVTHNDPNITSPQDYPITFYVIADFRCPQSVIMSTGVE